MPARTWTCRDFELANGGRERRTAAAVLDQDGFVDLGRLQAVDLLAFCRDPVMVIPPLLRDILRVDTGHEATLQEDRNGLGTLVSLNCFVHEELLDFVERTFVKYPWGQKRNRPGWVDLCILHQYGFYVKFWQK